MIGYILQDDEIRRIMRFARNWGRHESESERMSKIGDMELFETALAATRMWDGPGEYRVDGPIDAIFRERGFCCFEEFIDYISNFSRTIRMEKVRDVEYGNGASGGYKD